MEQNSHQLIECNKCGKNFPVQSIEIYPRIVRKERIAAIAYCFRCPECGQEYICYFKDSQVNAFFKKGEIEKAQHRMRYLKEVFTNDTTV